MAQQTFGIDKGITIFNNDTVAKLYWENFSGTAPVNGFGSDGDYATDSISGHFYKKTAGVWAKFGISAEIASSAAGFRIVGGFEYFTEVDVSGFTGLTQTMDGATSVTFTVGDKVASGFDDTVYVASAGAWTLFGTQPIANDVMFIQNVLNDASYQKGVSMFKMEAANLVKIADFDFELATTIGFSSYTPPASGALTAIAGTDSVQGAVEKLDTHTANLLSVLGTALTDLNLGTLNGRTVTDNSTVKTAIQSIVDKARYESLVSSPTSATVIDSVSITDYKRVQWLVELVSDALNSDRYSALISASNDGATGVSHSFSQIIQQGSAINGLTITVDIDAGAMRLIIASTQAVSGKAVRYTV